MHEQQFKFSKTEHRSSDSVFAQILCIMMHFQFDVQSMCEKNPGQN